MEKLKKKLKKIIFIVCTKNDLLNLNFFAIILYSSSYSI